MQAFEIVESINKSQENKEERSLVLGLYLSLVVYTIEEFKDFNRSIAFQIFEVPDDALHSVAILPVNISNLHQLNLKTLWDTEFHVATSVEMLHEALIGNMRVSEIILAIMARFAKKHSLSYTTELEVESFRNLKLVFQFEKILSND